MFSLILASLLWFGSIKAFEIGSIVFVNTSNAKISTTQYPKAKEIASKLHGRFAKIVGQTINSHNHSKWIVQSLHNPLIKLKIKEEHLSICPTFRIPLERTTIQFHFISSNLGFEEYKLWRRLRLMKNHKFVSLGLVKPSFGPKMIIPKSVQCLQAVRLALDPRLASENATDQADALFSLMMLSPEWMASVFGIVKRRIEKSERSDRNECVAAVEKIERIHKAYHIAFNPSLFSHFRGLNLDEAQFNTHAVTGETQSAEMVCKQGLEAPDIRCRLTFINIMLIDAIRLKCTLFVDKNFELIYEKDSAVRRPGDRLELVLEGEMVQHYFSAERFDMLHIFMPVNQIVGEFEVSFIKQLSSMVEELML